MSESSDKLRTFSRREPVNGRQPRRVPKAEPKRVRVPNQNRAVAEAPAANRFNNNIVPPAIASGGGRTRQGLVMPSAVKPIPKTKAPMPQSRPNHVKVKTVRVQKQPMTKIGRKVSRKTRLKPMARAILYAVRLLIVGVGIGAIVGTVLSVLDPATRIAPTSTPSNTTNPGQTQSKSQPSNPTALYLSQELIPLKNSVQELAAASPNLTPGVFLVDLDTGGYVDINAANGLPAASTIKIPILVAFFQDVDAGKIRLDEMLTMQQEMIAGGSGQFQYKPAGTQYPALEVATKMITISDNTATNILIARLGGIAALNERFRSWGLTTTVIRNQLPDLPGTNTTSPKELGSLMAMVSQGNLVSMRSRDQILDIMRRTQRDNLLPAGLGAGARVYHKTGDIGTVLADAGLIDTPTGKRYVVAVMVQRPNNDPRAEKLISSISRAAYQQFIQSEPTPSNTTSTVPPTGYPSPVNNSPVPNIPVTGYPTPVLNPQYYPPR
ncbi:serine hydrolase [Nostoc sp. TCL26-01]|uniref:serine hydrolase n=1 Tax=Nostoc sp. TCL26-01 TaxID=2576904 RepID=UPI0015C0C9A6|nr:serine hydrolase [Nostoc sp. TCL26-01]